MMTPDVSATSVRRVVAFVVASNLAYFGVEVVVAAAIGSVSLFADSIDFLEDASLNLLILLALGWSAGARRIVGMGLAAILLVPGLATLWLALQKILHPQAVDPVALTVTGLGALLVNLACALMLARVRHHGGSLTRAAFLSSRNDVAANVAIVAAGLLTQMWPSVWPDVVVGLGIALMNADAAHEVFVAARAEGAGLHVTRTRPPN